MADSTPSDATAKSKLKSPLVIGLIVALLLATGLCVYAFTSHGSAAPAEAAPKAEVFLPLDPAFVVNFKDGDSLRYLQVNVTLMAHDAETIEAAKQADSIIRNSLIMLLSQQDFSSLSSLDGKKKLQAEALKEIQKIVAARYPRSTLSALYFTNFVME